MVLAIQDGVSQTVKLLNELPRSSRLESVPNDWYFDVRYIPLEPTPHHILFLIRPADNFVHVERLPLGIPQDESGIAYFPETAAEAAPEVAKALIHSFVNDFGRTIPPKPSAPWKLSTFDAGLAVAVGKVFRRLEVREELWRIGVAKSLDSLAQTLCDQFFTTLKRSMEVTYFVPTPQSIAFSNYQPPRDDFFIVRARRSNDVNTDKTMAYTQDFINSRPVTDKPEDMLRAFQVVTALFQTKLAAVTQAEADAGNPASALELAFRLRFGCGCFPNRRLERAYFIKALSPQAPPEIRATAHAALIDWYMASVDDFRSRAMHAACHHADQAARLSVHTGAPPAVLMFLSTVFKEQTKDLPFFPRLYKSVVKAGKRREAEMEQESSKLELKRLHNPNRYRCAAVGCELLADSGRMLAKCAGNCDPDKKPSYCSKECQKADWPNHKPFCKAGATCSVIDTTPTGNLGGATKKGAIQVNVKNADGTTTSISSSTFTANQLKEFREAVQSQPSRSGPSKLHMELFEI